MYRDALIHDTSCDSQALSLIIIIIYIFVDLVFILFYSLGQCLPALLNLLEAEVRDGKPTSESTACFDTSAITENGICITLLSVKLSRW